MHVVNADLQKLFMKDKKGIVRAYTFFKKTVGRHVKQLSELAIAGIFMAKVERYSLQQHIVKSS